MKIEAGKCYVLRNGAITEPLEWRVHPRFPWVARVHKGPPGTTRCIWSYEGGGYESPQTDIVAEFASVEDAQRRYDKPTVTKASLLDDAKAAVADRGLNYGKPEDNFARIARLWSAHLYNTGKIEDEVQELTAIDVALMMDLMKTARLENDPLHQDSWVDKAGYAACGGEIAGGIAKDA